jgi:HicB family
MGRPSIGPHTEFTARVPPELHEAIRAEAKAQHISMSRLVVQVLQEQFGSTHRRRSDPTQVTAVDILAGRSDPPQVA